MESPKRSMTREELYKLVWSTPIQKLAAAYGLSDKGLAKTCSRYLVPVPPRGSWAKIEAGQSVKPTPLRSVENKALHNVYIGKGQTLNARSPYVIDVIARAKEEIAIQDARLASKPAAIQAPPIAAKNEQAAQALEAASGVPKANPEKLRSTIKSFIAELKQCKEDRDGFVWCKWVKVPPKDFARLGSLFNDIAARLEPYQFSFVVGERQVGFKKDDVSVSLRVEAPRKKEVGNSKYDWKSFTYVHAGRFKLRIDGHAEGVKKEWNDTDTKTIEDCLDKIVESIRLNHIANKEWEIKARETENRRAHLAMRRKMVVQRQEREKARLAFLHEIAEARREAQELRATIALASPCGEVSNEYHLMMDWARSRLADLEEKTVADAIQRELIKRELFQVPDPLFDPEGDPPAKKNYWDD